MEKIKNDQLVLDDNENQRVMNLGYL